MSVLLHKHMILYLTVVLFKWICSSAIQDITKAHVYIDTNGVIQSIFNKLYIPTDE